MLLIFFHSQVFLAPYPNKIQGGEFYSFAMVEKACRDAGTVLYNHGGFRALLTTKKRPLSKLLPPYMYNLPVVNIAVSPYRQIMMMQRDITRNSLILKANE